MNAKPPSNANQSEKTNDTPTDSTGGTATDAMASQPQRPGQPTGSLSPGDTDLHPELNGDGKRAGQPGTSCAIAQTTQPQDATQELMFRWGRTCRRRASMCRFTSAIIAWTWLNECATFPGWNPLPICWPGWIGASSGYTRSRISMEG